MRACQEAISSSEFTAWIAYYHLHPFGPLRDDQRAGTIAAMIANVNRGKGVDPFTWLDFFPQATPQEPKQEQTWEQMLAIAEIHNAVRGGLDLRSESA